MLELWSLGLHPVQKKICGVHGRAAARLLLIAAIKRFLLAAGPTAANPQQQHAAAGWHTWRDGRPTVA